MAQVHYKTLLGKVLLGFISEQDRVLAMLEWVAHQMMLIEAEGKVGAEKGKHSKIRTTHFSGKRVRMEKSLSFTPEDGHAAGNDLSLRAVGGSKKGTESGQGGVAPGWVSLGLSPFFQSRHAA